MSKNSSTLSFTPDLYCRVVAMNAQVAKEFFGLGTNVADPVDLGIDNSGRFKPGAHVWGFPSREETAAEKAHRIWTVARGGEVML